MPHGSKKDCIDFIRQKDALRNWKNVKITAFDAPQATDKPYSQRLQYLEQSTKISYIYKVNPS
jgi:hypothetical protein